MTAHHLILLLLVAICCQAKEAQENLYAILGVRRTATTKQLKKAYRRKALDTHPDKNKNVPPAQAAEEFQRVVHAFAVLSDDGSRRIYDQSGRATERIISI